MSVRKKVTEREQKFIICWSGLEPQPIDYDGGRFWVPGREEVAHASGPNQPTKYRFLAAEDRLGKKLPGTVEIRDRKAPNEAGAMVTVFDAYACAQYLESDELQPKQLRNRGLTVVSEPEEVELAIKEGIELYETSQDANARLILEQELSRRTEYVRAHGMEPPISSSDEEVRKAQEHLERRKTIRGSSVSTDALKTALSSSVAATPPTPKAEGTDVGDLFAKATGLGIALPKVELAGLLTKDPEAVLSVRKKIEAREAEMRTVVSAPA